MFIWYQCETCHIQYNTKNAIWKCKRCLKEICDTCSEIDCLGVMCTKCYKEYKKVGDIIVN